MPQAPEINNGTNMLPSGAQSFIPDILESTDDCGTCLGGVGTRGNRSFDKRLAVVFKMLDELEQRGLECDPLKSVNASRKCITWDTSWRAFFGTATF